MLKPIICSIILMSGFNVFAANPPDGEPSAPKSCDKLLNMPARFRSAVSMYSDQRYLQPVAKFTVNTTLYQDVQRFDKVELDSVMNPAEFNEETKITAAIENFPQDRTIHINDLVMSGEFSEEYGLKLFLAHYLDRYPEIERVEMAIFSSQLPVTYSILREGLARGMSLHQALASTPAVLA